MPTPTRARPRTLARAKACSLKPRPRQQAVSKTFTRPSLAPPAKHAKAPLPSLLRPGPAMSRRARATCPQTCPTDSRAETRTRARAARRLRHLTTGYLRRRSSLAEATRLLRLLPLLRLGRSWCTNAPHQPLVAPHHPREPGTRPSPSLDRGGVRPFPSPSAARLRCRDRLRKGADFTLGRGTRSARLGGGRCKTGICHGCVYLRDP